VKTLLVKLLLAELLCIGICACSQGGEDSGVSDPELVWSRVYGKHRIDRVAGMARHEDGGHVVASTRFNYAVEILGQLVQGRKTLTEITESVYGLSLWEEGWQSSYSKVARLTRRLESKGLVSRRLFGKEKPYRLTDLAVTNLARIGGEKKQLSMIPRIDVAFYLATLGSSLVVAALAMGWYELSELGTLGLFGAFCLLLGVSLTRFVQAFRRVF
jgi:hypothetical protein